MSKCSGMKQVNALAMIFFMLRRRGALIKATIAQTQQEGEKKITIIKPEFGIKSGNGIIFKYSYFKYISHILLL